jgi:GxxExxY protein
MNNNILNIEELTEDEISNLVINSAIKVHKAIGPGLLESAYEACLLYELNKSFLDVKKQVPLPLQYEGVFIDCAYRADIIVNNKVIIEIKAIKKLDDIHFSQLLSYLKISKMKLGLLINFNETTLIQGLKRVVNGL